MNVFGFLNTLHINGECSSFLFSITEPFLLFVQVKRLKKCKSDKRKSAQRIFLCRILMKVTFLVSAMSSKIV